MGHDIEGLVLAGGRSRRLGTDKALLALHGRPVIQWTVERVASVCDHVTLVVNEPDRYRFLGLPMVTDVTPYGGPLVGLYSGLRHTSAPWTLALACDMPLVRTELLQWLLKCRNAVDAALPVVNGLVQPFPGLYSRDCVGAIDSLLASGKSAARDLAQACHVTLVDEETIRKLDPGLLTFRDIDTPGDFEAVQAAASGGALP